MENKLNIFMPHTPYHVLLAYAIAKSDHSQQSNHLIVSGESSTEIFASVMANSSKLFDQVFILPNSNSSVKIGRGLANRMAISRIRKYLINLKREPRNLYVFHRSKIEPHSLLNFGLQKYPECLGNFVEDGLITYLAGGECENTYLEKITKKITYGLWWNDIYPLYSTKFIQRMHAIFPDELPSDFQKLQLQPISSKPMFSKDMERIIEELFVKINYQNNENYEEVYLLPHSDSINDIGDVQAEIKQKNSNVAIKQHPRDSLEWIETLNCEVIPSTIPIELIYITNENIKRIVGTESTALLTGCWLSSAEIIINTSESSQKIEEIVQGPC